MEVGTKISLTGKATPLPPQTLERQAEQFLLHLVPDLKQQWQGATKRDIERLQTRLGQTLPSFYHWFLRRMGQNMGPLAMAKVDFSAKKVLKCHANPSMRAASPRYFLIGYTSDPLMQLHVFYDLSASAMGDACVVRRDAGGGEAYYLCETFREWLLGGAFLRHKLYPMTARCEGTFSGEGPDWVNRLDPLMQRLGFTQPVTGGSYFRIFERKDVAMVCSGQPMTPHFLYVHFGGTTMRLLRKVVGLIAKEKAVTVEIDNWNPSRGRPRPSLQKK